MKNEVITNLFYDKVFRKNLSKNPKAYIKDIFGENADESVEYRVVCTTKEINYVVIPYINNSIDIQQLSELNAAGVSTAGSASTAGTAGSISTTFSSASSGATVGTAASA